MTELPKLKIAGREFRSRLILGTGKYKDADTMVRALEASGTEMVTVALRRVSLDELGKGSLIDSIDQEKYLLLPNTAGCYTADEAIRTARLARELGGWEWIKLEVIGDKATLFPDTAETLRAAAENGIGQAEMDVRDPLALIDLDPVRQAALVEIHERSPAYRAGDP